MDGEDEERYELMVIQYGVLPRLAEAALDAIEQRYSSYEEYFEQEFGLGKEHLEALRNRYLE
jgi:protein-tyrosine phosphatase